MPILPNFHAFEGRHHETGSIANALAYQGVKAPHTGQPLSEALLLGISGGITVGYFLFHYTGYEPHLALLTRNTFDPLDTLLERLALPQDVRQTTDPRKAEANLVACLDSGYPPIVWADAWTLTYNGFSGEPTYGAMFPLVVYGCEAGMVSVCDRSSQPLHVDAEKFTAARGKVKQVKHRLMTLQPPNFDRLPSAVQKGIWQCINLFTEMPPRGTKDNFGLAALEKWAEMLTNTRNKQSWTRFFPRGAGLYSALAGHPSQPGAFQWICTWGATDGAERGLYADFLDEAATILEKPGLRDAAKRFRDGTAAWNALATMMLPDAVEPLFETRYLLVLRRRLFIEDAEASLDERQLIGQRLSVLRAQASTDFPMSDAEVSALLERLAEQVLVIRRIEGQAVEQMQAAMA